MRNALKKNSLFLPGRNTQNGLILHACNFWDMPIAMAQVFEAVHSDVSELWAICMHYLGNCSS